VAIGVVELAGGGSSGGGARIIQASVSPASASAQLRLASGHGELVVQRMPAPPGGHIYEVWLKRGEHVPTPTRALFSVTAAGAGDVAVPGDLRGVTEVLVTAEPDGGSAVPTSAPVITAHIA
jgi:hypothetical protein